MDVCISYPFFNQIILIYFLFTVRILVFHVKFLDLIARPSGKSLNDIAKEYDERLGMPSEQQKQDLLQLSAEAQKISSFSYDILFTLFN